MKVTIYPKKKLDMIDSIFSKIEMWLFNFLNKIKIINDEDNYNIRFDYSDKKIIKMYKRIRKFIKKYKRFFKIFSLAIIVTIPYFIFYDNIIESYTLNMWINILSVLFIVGGVINIFTPFGKDNYITKEELPKWVKEIIEEKKEKDEENERIEKNSYL